MDRRTRPVARSLSRMALLAAVLVLAGCKVALNSNLRESDANEMMARLLAEGIQATKVVDKEGVTLMVPKADFGTAVDILASHGLPRREFATINDVFQSEGLVASPLQEWARFHYAKSQELSQSISTIPGVIKADVHLAYARSDNPFAEPKPPSASVLIQMQADLISEDLVPNVKQLVAFAMPEIEYERVGVIVAPVHSTREEPRLIGLWGLVMHESSAEKLRNVVTLAGAAIVLLIAAGAGVFFFLRGGRRRKTQAAST
ncbi:MAG: type III secretion inner membrane ring lipoprotein SctJ [Rhodobacteraceae bacterium]|jgi:type III secretion protein J|nr:type III secretion inner membrane ring lipoprotein SctJ [Paracoccaceae bacterium]